MTVLSWMLVAVMTLIWAGMFGAVVWRTRFATRR
jgi:hypothetical protein